jgi:hypothetical protein
MKEIAGRLSQTNLDDFGVRYAQAWSSQRPEAVAAMFAEDGWIAINDDAPAYGRGEVEEVASGFMTDFPDLDVHCDCMALEEGELRWYWTMQGTNSGPRGSGRSILISGYESLVLGEDGLIVSAHGHFDPEDWDRQLGG